MQILSGREARNILHLPFPFVLLIKFIGQDSFVICNSALLLAAKRYGQGYDDHSCDKKQTLKQTNYEQFWW
jgi:hypothetical protein